VKPVASTTYSSLHNATTQKIIIYTTITARTAKCQKTGRVDVGMG
jgi:hypothetical protein